MIVLIKLILAHFIGDFLMQPQSWVKHKEAFKIKSSKLYGHVLIHGLLVLVLLWDIRLWWVALSVVISHWIIDLIKLYNQKDTNKSQWFIIDQFLHLIVVIALWALVTRPEFFWSGLLSSPLFWGYLTAVVFLTFVVSVIMQVLLSRWSPLVDRGEPQSLKDAGKYIGILERLLIFVFIITNHWEAIGFLIAAKSVFRFGDLKETKDRRLTEYILIGTLLSFGIAILTGLLVKNLPFI